MAHAIPDDHVGAFRFEPAVHHRPVDRVHQIRAHQSFDIAELLLEHVSPPRCPDRIVATAQLPRPDGRYAAGHRGQLVFEACDGARVSFGQHPQQQGASSLIPETFFTEPVEYLAETVLAMCHLPVAERTDLVAFSLHYP